MRRIIAVTTVAFLCVPSACMIGWWDDWYEYQAESTESFSVTAVDLEGLSAHTHNGDLTVIGNPAATDIAVVARVVARGKTQEDAEANLADVSVTREVSGRELELGWEWSTARTRGRSASVSYRIEAPPHLVAEITSHNGRLSVTGWSGDVRGETHNGPVELEGGFAALELTTHNGSVTARLGGAGSVDGTIETHNGEVDVQVGEGLSARLIASTHNGPVSYGGVLNRVEAGHNFLVGDAGDGAGRLRITTHNGAVRIR